ncbi:hypothetical protein [Mesorhizobium shangrilense]|uniref:Uncharacterized protein n=1 Tax=Mesorhizobium shangrilense TaxID=460060 RepID=A0ABV2DG06_9HYPH
MIIRGIGHVVAGQACGDDPSEHDEGSPAEAGSSFVLLQYIWSTYARLKGESSIGRKRRHSHSPDSVPQG